ncbi:uncharacterized protein LOC141591730 isoform X2 [Silene latifolia]|uniref:uncharacterized protein LOC141591730 isoform X2 n=1 Tax=Silene latifolia TaxID=37657 RepID=UPI003D773963
MSGEEQRNNNNNDDDFYAILGLHKDCTQIELKSAYKKLAMRWHPDRCSSSGNSKFVEEAKKKFQAIQTAYSVLSDETKRFMYDVGVYDNDDDQNNHGMGEFLNEMATMMCEQKPNENGEESFEQLQELFEEMFQRDNGDAFPSTSSQGMTPCSSAFFGSMESPSITNKRSCSEMNSVQGSSPFNPNTLSYRVGTGGVQGKPGREKGNQHRGRRRSG